MSARQRIVAGTAAQLSWQAVDQDGEPSDPGTTTVEVLASDGSTVIAAGTATTATGTVRTVALDPQVIDTLTITWTGANAVETVEADVVGGVFFTTASLRSKESSVSVEDDYPLATVQEARAIVETVFTRATGILFVPQFLQIPVSAAFAARRSVREVRWGRLIGPGSGYTYITGTQLANSVRIVTDGVRCSSSYDRLGVVAGMLTPPQDVVRVAKIYCRHLLTEGLSSVDFRVLAIPSPDGFMQPVATPGQSIWVTGLPVVDEVLKDYRNKARRVPRSITAGAWFA